LTRRGDAASVVVVNDSLLALPAACLEDGVAVICGTGSTAVGRHGNQVERAGGWGYLLGDEGSAYWITREAVRELSRRNDEHEPLGSLGAALLEAASADDVFGLIHRWHEALSPSFWADLAPVVLDCDDPAAGSTLEGAARSLAELAASVQRRVRWPECEMVPVVLAGSLVKHHAGMQAATRSAIEGLLPRADVRVAKEPPVTGAVCLAMRVAQARGS